MKVSLDVRTVRFEVRKYFIQTCTDIMMHISRKNVAKFGFVIRTVGFERFGDIKKPN